MGNGYDYDLLVIGGGMAGLPVAMKCAYCGMETTLIEENFLGGTCLNRGYIPTKAMLRSAEVANFAHRSKEFGIDIDGTIEADMDAIVVRKDNIVESIREGAYENMKSNENIDFIEGHGVLAFLTKSRSTTEPSRPKLSSSIRAPGRRSRQSKVSTTFTTAPIYWNVTLSSTRWPSSGVGT